MEMREFKERYHGSRVCQIPAEHAPEREGGVSTISYIFLPLSLSSLLTFSLFHFDFRHVFSQ